MSAGDYRTTTAEIDRVHGIRMSNMRFHSRVTATACVVVAVMAILPWHDMRWFAVMLAAMAVGMTALLTPASRRWPLSAAVLYPGEDL